MAVRSALLTVWNNAAKMATFVHYICEQCSENRTIHALGLHLAFDEPLR